MCGRLFLIQMRYLRESAMGKLQLQIEKAWTRS